MSVYKPFLTILLTCSLLHAQSDEPASELLTEHPLQDIPNVILIIADDLGNEDLAPAQDRYSITPHIQQLAQQSLRWENFYVSPVDTLSRASLFTGRYNARTKVLGESFGLATMANDEITLAEALSESGYKTGIFGTWGLGDHYPSRATDQGFQTSLTHRGASFNHPAKIISSNGEQILLKNNYEHQVDGNLNDIFFSSAKSFIQQAKAHQSSFFVTISTSNPATTPAESHQHLINFDKNVGELTALLKAEEVDQNTIIILLGDTGSRFTESHHSLRGNKGSLYEGGVKSSLLISWPAKIQHAQTVRNNVAAHIDIMPTIMDACGYGVEEAYGYDGRSLLPQIEKADRELPERAFVQQWHRGQRLTKNHHFMVRKGNWKLLNPSDPSTSNLSSKNYELYDLNTDPKESKNLASENQTKATELLAAYNEWFKDVTDSRIRDAAPSYILVDRQEENPLVLTWQNRLAKDWGYQQSGFWKLSFEHEGRCDVRVEFPAEFDQDLTGWTAEIYLGKQTYSQVIHSGEHHYLFPNVQFARGNHHLRSTFTSPDGLKTISGYQVRLSHR